MRGEQNFPAIMAKVVVLLFIICLVGSLFVSYFFFACLLVN